MSSSTTIKPFEVDSLKPRVAHVPEVNEALNP